MILVALVIFAICCLVFDKEKDLRTLWRQIRLDIPTHKSFPIIGHYNKFHGLNTEEAFVATNEFSLKFPEISKLWQFHHLNIFINSPQFIERVLMSKSCLQRPLFLLKFFDINDGLLSSRIGQWSHDRRFMNQYFNPKMINSYVTSMVQCVDILVSKLSAERYEDIDLLPQLERCALHAVCSTLFGMSVMDKRIDEICSRTAEIFYLNSKTFEAGLKNPLRFIEIVHKRTSNYRKVQSAQNFLTKLLMEMEFDHGNSEGESMLEVLIKSEGERFTKKQICEHILTFLNAGLDTTAAHLHYTILFLAMHSECQEKLAQEVKSFFDTSEEIDYNSISKLDYLDRVMKESFRLAPPIFLIGRETVEDFEIFPGCVIPKDTPLAINTFVLHRREDIYGKDSNIFNPDHFSPEAIAQRHPFSFQPFSTGRRNCIGYRFAIIFIKLVLVQLIREFEFSSKSRLEDLRFKYGLTLKLTEDHRVSIKSRK